jgi:hypothetical protein
MIKGRLTACADHEQKIIPGTGPHTHQLWCTVCNKHSQWFSKKDLDALNTTEKDNKDTAL